ncbi:DUF4430 domain-containing protein [Ruminococcus sp. Marseille-P6503]|uniref:DUF4430 domain-containing protein n=1 Tax=Ruminococcus sp. Marseille-P6503 TaxID=2364796 RepID=UPI000F526E34|nr:DUF4430 domain-containing protein [Ruminococcus sp. Marseille-P6503]
MKITAKILSAAAAIFACSVSWSTFAEDGTGKVRVTVENNTFSIAEGAAWDGELLDVWIDVDEAAELADAVKAAFEDSGYSISGLDMGYVTDINGVGIDTAADMGGWMFTLNDWFTNEVMSAYTVSDGDEICFQYTCNWGPDIGSDWSSGSTLLKDLVFSAGTLDKAFDPQEKEYTLSITDGSESVKVVPTAENKNFQVRTYKTNYTPEADGSEYKRSEYIPVSNGDVLYIGVGNSSWPSMNSGQTETVYSVNIVSEKESDISDQLAADEVDGLIAQIGEVTINSKSAIEKARAAYARLTDAQKALCKSYDVLVAAEEAYAKLVEQKLSSFDEIFESVGDSLLSGGIPQVSSVGGEWTAIGLARSGRITDEFSEGYYENAVNYLRANGSAKLSNTKSADNSRMILALTSLGYDVTDVGGYNILEPLSDFDYVVKQGINGAAWALIAFDSNNYDIPVSDSDNPASREKLVDYIISQQLSDGAFSLDGENADIDVTAMVITSLAPYYEDETVKAAVDKALDMLSASQNGDGTFSSGGQANCESAAQMIVALSSLGIDPSSDERFVKDGVSALDALKLFYIDGGFKHTSDSSSVNQMSTEQGYYAIAAYYRFVEGKNTLFDMTDVVSVNNPAVGNTDESSEQNTSDIASSSSESKSDDKVPATGSLSGAIAIMLAAVSAGAAMTLKKKSEK